ncbi:class I SAM-dependent methyltransferase [Clostridium oceanicum]|uniref:Class I SAM-dependent methyltransferase n=1 Tax=Clostridium oceanicum TaxID=1543 RepID=A0ABP3UP17_9CLOT
MMKNYTKPYYGVNKTKVIINSFSIGLLCLLVSMFLFKYTESIAIGYIFLVVGVIGVLNGLRMINYVIWGKFKHRDRIVDSVDWKGNEKVLDVGIGRGLVAIKAAKKLTTGKLIGIDIWKGKGDILDNTKFYINKNMKIEGVEDKIKIKTQNASALSFKDESFDVVLSNLCIHNIHDKDERIKAICEMARVVKKDGTLVLSDFRHTIEHKKLLCDMGFKVKVSKPYIFDTYPSLKIIVAKK